MATTTDIPTVLVNLTETFPKIPFEKFHGVTGSFYAFKGLFLHLSEAHGSEAALAVVDAFESLHIDSDFAKDFSVPLVCTASDKVDMTKATSKNTIHCDCGLYRCPASDDSVSIFTIGDAVYMAELDVTTV